MYTNARENNEDIIKCDFAIRMRGPQYNPIKICLSIYYPQGTYYKDKDGNDLLVETQAGNVLVYDSEYNGWLGFRKNAINFLPGTHTYYAQLSVKSGKTRRVEAQSDYIPFTITGPQNSNTNANQVTGDRRSYKVLSTEEMLADVEATANKLLEDMTKSPDDEKAGSDKKSVSSDDANEERSDSYEVTNVKVNLRSKTAITMEAIKELKVDDANEGDLIEFSVNNDIVIDGLIAVPKHSKGQVEVLSVNRGGDFSEKESMKITPVYIVLPNGERIPVVKKILTISGFSARGVRLGEGSRGVLKKGYKINCEVASSTSVFAYNTVNESQEKDVVPRIVYNTDVHSPIIGTADIDKNIPSVGVQAENTFAVIIANENYTSEEPVEFAINDGRTFKEYCRRVLGIPDQNIHYCENATKNNIVAEIDWVTKVAEAYGSDAKMIIYYAGHGIPDERTSTSYLLPVDGIGTNVKTGYSLETLYSQLSALPASNITVIMDACFSGAKRGDGMLANARGVAIKAKPAEAKGNLVVFSATQGDETAYPYKEKGHGLFTYFLLKKLQDTKGGCTLSELGDYVRQQVSRRSIVVNGKSQTPKVSPSPALGDKWKNLKLR